MKTIKNRICLLLSFAIVVSCLLNACGGTTGQPQESALESGTEPGMTEYDIVIEKELERALSYGLVPEGWEEDLEQTVTYKEFCDLVTSLIQKVKPENLPKWDELANKAMASDETIGRDDTAVGLLYAAQALDCCFVHECLWSELQNIQNHPDFWNYAADSGKYWPDLPDGYQMLQRTPGTPMGTEFLHGSWGDAAGTAQWFILQRHSLINEKPLLDYDDSYDMRWMDHLTRQEAICAVLRLGESESNLLENNHYISVYDHTTYDTSIITEELLNSSSNLPEPTHEKLPSTWKGMGISKTKDTVNNYYRDF